MTDDIVHADETDTRVPLGYLAAARSAGAHDQYIAFVAEYPESPLAEGLERAISMDALDRFESFSGSFEWQLFDRGAAGAGAADLTNARRLYELFPMKDLPDVVAEQFEDDD